MTDTLFLERANALIEEAKAAGLNPHALLIRLGVRQGSGWLDGVLTMLQNGNAAPGKK